MRVLDSCPLWFKRWLLHTSKKKKKNHAQDDLCDSGMYSREIINMFLLDQVSWLAEEFNVWISSDTINVIKVQLCMIVLLIELYLIITTFCDIGHISSHSNNVEQFQLKFVCSYPIRLKLCRIVK